MKLFINRGYKVFKEGLTTKEYLVAYLVGEGKIDDFFEFYAGGKIKQTGRFRGNNSKEDRWVYYYNNGQNQSEGEYRNGKKKGAWLYYKKDETSMK
ncbi:MAG: hypothetical protein IAF38_09875 [Bacteroidia bacterium]|nr:hypothetical protein [Bacteroidia bacterium]